MSPEVFLQRILLYCLAGSSRTWAHVGHSGGPSWLSPTRLWLDSQECIVMGALLMCNMASPRASCPHGKHVPMIAPLSSSPTICKQKIITCKVRSMRVSRMMSKFSFLSSRLDNECRWKLVQGLWICFATDKKKKICAKIQGQLHAFFFLRAYDLMGSA